MSEPEYTPQVGHRIRNEAWVQGAYFDVLHIDGDVAFGRDDNGEPTWEDLKYDGPYVRVVERPELPDTPNKWARIRKDGTTLRTEIPVWGFIPRLDQDVEAWVEYGPTGRVVWPDELDQPDR